MRDESDVFVVSGKAAALLSLTEIGLGSAIHSFHVPLGGHFLSLNQGFILTRSVRGAGSWNQGLRTPVYVSTSAAVLKSLSPAGKKLTPMLAISVQGMLFSSGVFFLGGGVAGCILGMILLSIWGFVQPLLLGYLLFGQSLFSAIELTARSIGQALGMAPAAWLWVALVVILFKAVAAVGVAIAAWRSSELGAAAYLNRLLRVSKMPRRTRRSSEGSFGSCARLALTDLATPAFAICLALTGIFFVFADSSFSTTLWGLLRPIAVGYLLFLGVRLLPIPRVINSLESWGWVGLSRTLGYALTQLDWLSPGSSVGSARRHRERG